MLSIQCESVEGLQATWYPYTAKVELFVNTAKTKVMVIARGKIRKLPDVFYNGCKLDVVTEFPYLGILFSFNGSFKKCVEDRLARAKRALHGLKVKANNLHLPTHLFVECFEKNCSTSLFVWVRNMGT